MGSSNIYFLIAFIAVFYIFIFLPQIRKAKKQKAFKEALAKGDKVVTTGGIHGKVAELNELTVLLDVGGGIKFKVDRSAISMDASQLAEKESV